MQNIHWFWYIFEIETHFELDYVTRFDLQPKSTPTIV